MLEKNTWRARLCRATGGVKVFQRSRWLQAIIVVVSPAWAGRWSWSKKKYADAASERMKSTRVTKLDLPKLTAGQNWIDHDHDHGDDHEGSGNGQQALHIPEESGVI